MSKRYARVLMASPAGHTPEGALFVDARHLEWQQVEWLDPWDCEHIDTMCACCANAWRCDNDIELDPDLDAQVEWDEE